MSDSLLSNYSRLPLTPSHGLGTELWDTGGRRYLDFGGGIAVTSLGHCHPELIDALTSQASKLWHCSNLYQIPGQAALASRLADEIVGHPGRCLFVNSGAEANESLIKLARRYGNACPAADGKPRVEIITFSGSFHGRTYGGLSATAQTKIHDGCGPLLPGFRYLPFNDADALAAAVSTHTAAIFLEPIQGEGGIHAATPEFLQAAREIADATGALLLFDEVQCGLGRAGAACSWHQIVGADIIPDAVAWAKGLGGGFPIGAIWVRRRAASPKLCLTDVLSPGSHGSTFGGTPLACAVASRVIDIIQRDGLPARAAQLGRRISSTIHHWSLPAISGLRGLGLMLGIQLDAQLVARHIDPALAHLPPSVATVRTLMANGLLTAPAGPDVIRLLPPLTVSDEEIEEALTIIHQSLATWR
jgi:acetylornithine/N-succinyldiaminopimelate aminotransferase